MRLSCAHPSRRGCRREVEEWRKEAALHEGFRRTLGGRCAVLFEGPAEEEAARGGRHPGERLRLNRRPASGVPGRVNHRRALYAATVPGRHAHARLERRALRRPHPPAGTGRARGSARVRTRADARIRARARAQRRRRRGAGVARRRAGRRAGDGRRQSRAQGDRARDSRALALARTVVRIAAGLGGDRRVHQQRAGGARHPRSRGPVPPDGIAGGPWLGRRLRPRLHVVGADAVRRLRAGVGREDAEIRGTR